MARDIYIYIGSYVLGVSLWFKRVLTLPYWVKYFSLLCVLISSILAFACFNSGNDKSLVNVVFMAGFKPQANLPFVAVYVAQEKGFFRDQGLEVDIRHASSGEHLKLLVAGDVDFTTAQSASVLKRRSDPGLPIVAIALLGQRGQHAFVALEDSGIRTPNDWEGKTFGYKSSQPPEYLAILNANNVDRSKVSEVRVGYDPRILTEGKVDILAVFNSNEPDTIRKLGFNVNMWVASDYGIPNMGLTFITRDEIVRDDPDKIQRFLRASLKGLQYTFDNRDEALEIVMQYAPREDEEHQKFMLETELEDAVSALTDERGLGWMTDGQWKSLYDQLLEFNVLPNLFDYRTAYTDNFLQAVYDEGELRWP